MHATCFKKLFLLFIAVVSWPQFLNAQVSINEIMYDLSGSDTGREWIEIFNAGSAAVDMASWKLFENNSNHTLNSISGGTTLNVGAYAVIADDSTKFLTDWPGYTGILFDSAFSLNNTGENVALKDGNSSVIDEVLYDVSIGAGGDGNSLNKSGTSWIAALPTPGASNSLTATSITTASSTATTTTTTTPPSSSIPAGVSNILSTHYTAMPLTEKKPEIKFEVGAGRTRLSVTGSPLEFRAESNKEFTKRTIYRWSFGDGSTADGENVIHAYKYPGEYIVVLNVESQEGRAVSRTNVKIIEPDISITHISSERIEILNNSKNEINLYGRALVGGGKVFMFPEDTIIAAGQRISFDSGVTGINSFDASLVVMGTKRPEQLLVKLEEEKLDKIAKINAEIISLQNALAQAPTPKASVTEKVQVPEEVISVSKVASVKVAMSTSTTNSFKGWLVSLKRFFLWQR